VAVATTLANLRGGHGDEPDQRLPLPRPGGNCETLIYGAEVLGRPEWLRRAEEIGLQEIEACAAQRVPWPCGTYGSVEVPASCWAWPALATSISALPIPRDASVLIPLPE